MEIVGNKFVGHSNFKNYKTKKFIDQSQPRDNPKLRIIDSVIFKEWVLDTTELKTILGFTCNKANLINEQGHIVTAWYSTSLPKYHSPTTYDGLPGTILEITDYHTKYLMRATSFAQRYVQVVEPTHGKQVTRENARKIISKLYE